MRSAIGVFSLVMGLAIIGIWVALLTKSQVPEVAERKRSIWFHIGAEVVTATLLLVAGVGLLASDASSVTALSGAALGALLYSTINSPGYHADRNEKGPVVMFAVFAAISIASLAYLAL